MGRASAQETASGSIRGVVLDKDFDAPLPQAKVLAVETGQQVTTSDQGQYVFAQIAPGKYTLVFSKDGYVRQVRTDVLVTAGQLTDVDVALSGEFTEMEEFVVEDVLQLGAGSETALLALRFETPALLDSIGADLLSRAGASDAAGALKLVSGASVQDGKYAVIRGLPDRYVSSQMNGVRLPTADEDKRAVELDQFPAPIIESIQVSKTFTPDQQGDASGGAVNIQLKGVPDKTTLQFSGQTSFNSQVAGRDDFLTYEGGGINFLGDDDTRVIQSGTDWDGAAGTTTGDAPLDYKWSIAGGGKFEVADGVRVGGFASVFYERDSSFYDDGVDDSYWVVGAGNPLSPQYSQGTPQQKSFYTALYDVTRSQQSVQWGTLGTFGIESDDHAVGLTYLFTHTAEDSATLAIDTRGKEYYFPGYNSRDPTGIGNEPQNRAAAPYQRLETLEYTERSTGTLQLSGRDLIPIGEFDLTDAFHFKEPIFTWSVSESFADLDQPDKRQFGAAWLPASYNDVFNFTAPAIWIPLKPAANTNFGNFQRIFQTIEEDSSQASFNLKFPFQQWADLPGYVKVGLFDDQVDREFNQDTFSNFNDESSLLGNFNEPWSQVFPDEPGHPITASEYDIDYRGELDVFATYGMFDVPVTSDVNVIAGARFESTDISTVNDAEQFALWYPPGASGGVELGPGQADVDFSQDDVLPALALNYRPVEAVTVRAAYSQTIARQTFKELTPIIQQEYNGAPIFIGNPELQMSGLTNYDLRVDYTPIEGTLVSASWFKKDIDGPIEYVQAVSPSFTFTTPRNYPKGELAGFELEARQDLGNFWDAMKGFSAGVNGTLINSSVTLPESEAEVFESLQVPMTERDATNAPEYLLNAYFTYDIESTGTQFALFYTLQGDTLVAGAGEDIGNFIPNVYAKSFDTLNLSIGQRLGEYFKLTLAAKNLTNPEIEEVYRSDYTGPDVTKTSYTQGVEFSISLGASFDF
jgi:TonB-dependent receptor